ncbi:MAG: hypothetical protein HC820_08655 [Hydrococcus sp. RM1_1_31]|nr:hypothetical protein [Hydrococcus sp. RM1_1_31]
MIEFRLANAGSSGRERLNCSVLACADFKFIIVLLRSLALHQRISVASEIAAVELAIFN